MAHVRKAKKKLHPLYRFLYLEQDVGYNGIDAEPGEVVQNTNPDIRNVFQLLTLSVGLPGT